MNNFDDKIKKSYDVVSQIDSIYEKICLTYYEEAYSELTKLIGDINAIISQLLDKADVLSKLDINVPCEVINNQLLNFVDAYEHRDYMMISDVLRYEIRETMMFYIEILKELEKQEYR